MTRRHVLALAVLTVTAALPIAANSQKRVQPDAGPAAQAAPATPAPALLRSDLRVDDRFESVLDTGCTYEVTIRGSVRPVRENADANATTQHLRPDLRVAATVRCPNSTESHIQERRVSSTGVTREELEHLVELNATVHRMQNSGRCLYVPGVAFSPAGFAATELGYLCPRTTSAVRGGAVRGSTATTAAGRP